MLFTENRDRLIWHMAAFYDSIQYHQQQDADKSIHQIATGYVDNEISMEKGWSEYARAVQDVNNKNKRLLRAIKRVKGKTFYKYLMEIIKDSDGISECYQAELVKEPAGKFQEEKYGRTIHGFWVDQWAVGDSGDSWEGYVYVKIKENKYFKFHYSM